MRFAIWVHPKGDVVLTAANGSPWEHEDAQPMVRTNEFEASGWVEAARTMHEWQDRLAAVDVEEAA